MKSRSILYGLAITCAVVFSASSSWAGKGGKGEPSNDIQPRSTAHGASGCKGYFAPVHQNLQKTMPTEACVVSDSSIVAYACDENANPVHLVSNQKWGCVTFTTHNEEFRLAFKSGGQTDAKIFLVAVKTEKGWEARHVLWSTGQNTTVTWMSPQANTHFASNGGDPDTVIMAEGNNSPSTESVPVQQAKVDCEGLNLVKRIACELKNNPSLDKTIGVGVRGIGK